MYLSKLEIIGFKSFVQKTNLKFTKGISAIVGPNGCGKSNIVDAIRWVLGEQKTSVLRSDIMENVIFNGTKTRKPTSMAEVSITIENNKNILPVEYNEVVITRRLFRSGESEYLLNNTKCRLRDIIDLFMDTGLGSDSYSVIELKMVEAILSGRGDDRRALFEEAAGIKKYKIQRREADKKLSELLKDLTRVNDLIEEVRKSVNSLHRHAQKTRRYNALNEEYRQLETSLLAFQYNKYNNISKSLELEINEKEQNKIKYEIELADRNLKLSKFKSDFNSVDNELKTILEEEINNNNEISHAKQEIAVSEEKLNKISSDETRLDGEIKETIWKLENTAKGIENLDNSIIKLQSEIEEMKINLENSISSRDKAQKNTNNIREEVSLVSQELIALKSNLAALQINISKNNDKLFNIQKKISDSEIDKNKIQQEININDKKLTNSDEKKNIYIYNLDSSEKELILQKQLQEKLQTEIDSIRHQINEVKAELTNSKSSISFLKNLIDTNETSKFLINSNNWTNLEKFMLSEAVSIEHEFSLSIPVLINNTTDYFIVETQEEAQKALKLLQTNKKGKAGFICLDSIPEVGSPKDLHIYINSIKNNSEFNSSFDFNNIFNSIIGWFSEIVRVDKKIRNVLRLVYEGLVVVDKINFSELDKIFDIPSINAIVTLTGEYYHKSGIVRGGSISEGETGRIGKKEKIEKLKNIISKLEIKLYELEQNREEKNREFSQIDIQSIIIKIRNIESEKRNFENEIAQVKLYKQQLQNNYELIDKNTISYKEDINILNKESIEIQNQIEIIQKNISMASNKLNEKQIVLTTSDMESRSIEAKSREIEIKVVKSNSDLEVRKNEQIRLSRQLNNYYNSIENRKLELIQNNKLREELKIKISELKAGISELSTISDELKNKSTFLSDKKKNLQEQVFQSENDILEQRKSYDAIITSLHQKEIKLSEINTWIQHIIQNFENNYQIDINTTSINLPENFSEDETSNSILELKQKLFNLGNINFAAIEDYEKESERLQFLEKQVSDLLSSEKTLRETIEEINKIAEQNFINTFNSIRLNFQNLFRKLFNEEGEADVSFDTSNVLESEIHITAKPPNKRPNSIEQLSGGEKTLTAIALLFAIYLVKPSPFCILDEVDAPLDDANVNRFLKIIRNFSKETQFLIVTHNKTTMTAADTLYGVTMQEPGVSKTATVLIDEIK